MPLWRAARLVGTVQYISAPSPLLHEKGAAGLIRYRLSQKKKKPPPPLVTNKRKKGKKIWGYKNSSRSDFLLSLFAELKDGKQLWKEVSLTESLFVETLNDVSIRWVRKISKHTLPLCSFQGSYVHKLHMYFSACKHGNIKMTVMMDAHLTMDSYCKMSLSLNVSYITRGDQKERERKRKSI